MMQGLLFIDNLIYGLYELIEDKENQVVLEGIWNSASQQFIDEFVPSHGTIWGTIERSCKSFNCELLFADNNNMLRVSNKEAVGGKSIQFKGCIINWTKIEAPLIPGADDFPQSVRIPIIFRERIDQ